MRWRVRPPQGWIFCAETPNPNIIHLLHPILIPSWSVFDSVGNGVNLFNQIITLIGEIFAHFLCARIGNFPWIDFYASSDFNILKAWYRAIETKKRVYFEKNYLKLSLFSYAKLTKFSTYSYRFCAKACENISARKFLRIKKRRTMIFKWFKAFVSFQLHFHPS